jgi:aspartate/tyrosine/aromatic aminotransferase
MQRLNTVANHVSFTQGIELAPPDAILGTAIAFRKDTSPDKVNLGIGAYRTEEGKPYVFRAVSLAE